MLCHLRKAPSDTIAADELITALRASEVIVARSITELTAAGLLQVGEDGRARYAPATRDLDRLAAAADARYQAAPDSVRRTIVKASNPGVTAFADAFWLKGRK